MARELKEDTDHKNLLKRGAVWYIKRMVDGKMLVQSTGETDLGKARLKRDKVLNPYNLLDEKDRVQAVLARVATVDQQLAKIEDEKPATTIAHGWQAYLDQHNRPDTGPETLAVYEGQYEAFSKWFKGAYPKAPELRHVTQEQADRYAGHLLKQVGASTFNRHMNLLALVWKVLGKTARIDANPWKQIGRKRFVAHSRRELTIEELGAVFNTAKGEMRTLLALGTFCGLRLGDAASLEWGSVDMVRGIITFIPRKGAGRENKRVTLPIHRTLYDMLAEIPKGARRGSVLPTMAARYNAFDGALAKDVARVFLSCDIKTGANKLTKTEREALEQSKTEALAEGRELPTIKHTEKRASADVGFHSLRHTFVSLCAAGGVSQSVVQSLVGHGSPAMTQHYTHIGIETAQKAIALIPDVTHTNTPAEHADATDAKLAAVVAQLDGLTDGQLKTAAKKIREIVEKRKSTK